jgi:hypothetical protein
VRPGLLRAGKSGPSNGGESPPRNVSHTLFAQNGRLFHSREAAFSISLPTTASSRNAPWRSRLERTAWARPSRDPDEPSSVSASRHSAWASAPTCSAARGVYTATRLFSHDPVRVTGFVTPALNLPERVGFPDRLTYPRMSAARRAKKAYPQTVGVFWFPRSGSSPGRVAIVSRF